LTGAFGRFQSHLKGWFEMKILMHILSMLPIAMPAMLASSFALMGFAQTVPPAGGDQPVVEIGGQKVVTISRSSPR
jgi:hypothetical protein